MTAPPVKGVPPRRVVVHTTDFDDARRAMEHTFLPMAMWPMEPLAGLNMRLDSARVHEMTTSTVTFGRCIGLRSVESRTYHVAVPVTGVAESQAGLREPIVTTQEQAAIFSVDESFAIHWRGDCTQMCLDFPGAVLNSRLEQHLDVPLGKPLAFEAALLDGLLLAQRHNYSDALLRDASAAPPRAAREAVELFETSPERSWSVPLLAKEVHVSVRSLQEGFRRSLDTTPTRYLRAVRLRKIREDLLSAAAEDTTVGAIVYRWGIVNQGRFANSYQRKFGETPSDTLRGR